MKKVFVSDITLLASAKENLSFKEKLNIASALEKTGVDEVVLPGVTNEKEECVVCRTIANSLNKCAVAIPCDGIEGIEIAYECLKDTKNPSIQIALPVSTVQMEYMYHLKADKMLDKIAGLCGKASEFNVEVAFVAMDATRAEKGFLAKCAQTASDNGAKSITICDDAGICFPEEISALVKEIKETADIKVYVKPSDKLSMAAACSIEAIKSGADGVKTCANGGEYLNIDTFADIMRARGEGIGVKCGLDVTAIHNILSNISNDNTSASLDKPQNANTSKLKESSGISDIISAVKSLGYELSDQDNGKVYEEFKRVTAKKGEIGTRELEAIVASTAMQVPSTYHLVSYVVNSGDIITATANVILEKDGEKLCGVSTGDGPIDAAFHAIEQIIGHHYELDDFQIQAVTKGREAVGSSIIRLRADGNLYSGNGLSTDIIGACIRAYINALNKIVYEEN